MSLKIRPANFEDTSTIHRLISGLAEYEKLSDEMVATERQIHETLFTADPAAECLIAEWEGAPVGFALYFQNYSTFLAKPGIYLEDLFVEPDYRGRGIGKSLLTRVAQIALERNCGRMEWSVLNWNQPAIDFYESLGAKPMSEWTVYRLTGESLENLNAISQTI